jgi:hypothetical protein
MEPITKVTMNLYTKDVEWFKKNFPMGYQERIRDVIRAHIYYVKSMEGDE